MRRWKMYNFWVNVRAEMVYKIPDWTMTCLKEHLFNEF